MERNELARPRPAATAHNGQAGRQAGTGRAHYSLKVASDHDRDRTQTACGRRGGEVEVCMMEEGGEGGRRKDRNLYYIHLIRYSFPISLPPSLPPSIDSTPL